MKKLFIILAFVSFMTLPASAASLGFIYENSTVAGGGASDIAINKTGCATCKSYFGFVGVGDCSINAAMKNGNIKSLSYYDIKTKIF